MKVWVKWLILGILSIIFGLFVLANPIAASVSVTIMAGILFAASGVFQIVAGFGEEGTWAKLVGIVIGLFMVLLGILLGIELLFNGIGLIVLAFFLKSARGQLKA